MRAVFNDAYREESYATMVDEVVEKEGRVDVLVNNFGTGDPKHDFDVEHTDFEVFMGILRTNLASVYLSTQRVIPVMKKNGGGSIVNISSIGGLYPDLAALPTVSAKTPSTISPRTWPSRGPAVASAATPCSPA